MKTRALLHLVILSLCFQLPLMGQRRRETGGTRTTPPPPINADIGTITRDMADKAQDAWNIASNQRESTHVELYVALAGFAGSARAYAQMAADGRNETDLRNAGQRLVAGARDVDAIFSRINAANLLDSWSLVQAQVARLSDAYSLGYVYRALNRHTSSQTVGQTSRPVPVIAAAVGGRFRWRGRVDGSDYILVQASQVTIRHIEYRPVQDASYDLPAPLPQQPVQLKLTRLRGRGNVEIVRQPSAGNNYTLTILVEDSPDGDDLYEFEVIW